MLLGLKFNQSYSNSKQWGETQVTWHLHAPKLNLKVLKLHGDSYCIVVCNDPSGGNILSQMMHFIPMLASKSSAVLVLSIDTIWKWLDTKFCNFFKLRKFCLHLGCFRTPGRSSGLYITVLCQNKRTIAYNCKYDHTMTSYCDLTSAVYILKYLHYRPREAIKVAFQWPGLCQQYIGNSPKTCCCWNKIYWNL